MQTEFGLIVLSVLSIFLYIILTLDLQKKRVHHSKKHSAFGFHLSAISALEGHGKWEYIRAGM
jgi:hypothetical protein